MTTGDISNNVRKLRARLKAVKYLEDLDMTALAEGLPTAYLPIYHYVFTTYSPAVAQIILDKGIELYGKSDARFMEAVYKILRDVFTHKPSITKEQFFAKGFAERKVIMCTDILQLVKNKNSELNPTASKTTMKTGVRPRSATNTKNLPLAVPKTKRLTSERLSPRDANRNARQPPQVINELTAEPTAEPLRHLSTSASHIHPVRHMVSHADTSSSSGSSDLESIPQKPPSILSHHAAMLRAESKPVKHVSIASPRETRVTSPHNGNVQSEWNSEDFDNTPEDYRLGSMDFMTPSIKKVCTRSVEVVSIPRGEYNSREPSIVEIRAPTSDSVLHGPVPNAHLDITQLYETVETLTGQVMQLAQSQSTVRQAGIGESMDKVLSKIENLTARLVLLENRMSIVESKLPDVSTNAVTRAHSNHIETTFKPIPKTVRPQLIQELNEVSRSQTNGSRSQTNGSRSQTNGSKSQNEALVSESLPIFNGPGNSFAEELGAMPHSQKSHSILKETVDFSINYSPIRKVANGVAGSIMTANEDTFALETDDDARRASTPTVCGTFLGDSSIHCDISHAETKDTVSRIHNMMKETKMWLKDKQTNSEQETVEAEN